LITGIHGRIRSGKTLFLTAIAFWEYVFGKQIYSNYKLNFPSQEILIDAMGKHLEKEFDYDIENIKLKKPKHIDVDWLVEGMPKSATQIQDSTVCIDEGYIYNDSRKSMTEKNILFSYILLQSGKHETDVYQIAHQLRLEDVRTEENSFYEISCFRYPSNHKLPLQAVRIVVQDNYDRKIIKDFLWTDFQMYFSMYDTKQIIWSDKLREDTSESDILQLARTIKAGF
jgi:hypothetical protein